MSLTACDSCRLLLNTVQPYCSGPVLRLPEEQPIFASGVLLNIKFLFSCSYCRSFKRLKSLIQLGLSPCWNHCSRVTKHKKLLLYVSQDRQHFSSVIMVQVCHPEKIQVVEGFAFLPTGSYNYTTDCRLYSVTFQESLTSPSENSQIHEPAQKNIVADITEQEVT